MVSVTSRSVAVLGSTGSIGTQALEVIAAHPGAFTVAALTAGGNVELLARQAVEFDVPLVGVARGQVEDVRAAIAAAAADAGRPASVTDVVVGADAATIAAGCGADVVLNGITGSIGLRPTLAALEAGSVLALANKESLIIGGPLVKAAAAPDQIVPVDSEHSAIAQSLRGGRADEVRRLVVTASGGPFRGRSRAELADVTPQQALAHPNFSMGRVITTNSATLVNKGLEVIEAHLLFDIPFDRIDVVVHPQQQIHSMVEFHDGSTDRPARPAAHARADRARAVLAAAPDRRRRAVRLEPGPEPGSSTRSTTTPSPPCAWRAGSARPGAPSRPSTTPPTRCASTPSTTG
jgi:1-deoxy-D-xylulose-5-phosphate reductoisomerase